MSRPLGLQAQHIALTHQPMRRHQKGTKVVDQEDGASIFAQRGVKMVAAVDAQEPGDPGVRLAVEETVAHRQRTW